MTFNRKTAPEPLDPVPFNIPNAFVTTLANGLRVVIFEDGRLPVVSFRLAFLSGDAHDPQDLTGVTSAMASMITEGTENYSSREIAEKIERLGAGLSASSSDDFTVVAGSSLSMYSSEVMQLISEVVFASTFPEEELDLYRRNTLENLKYQRSQPNFLASEQSARLLYGNHPYGTVSPKPADIMRLTREALIAAKHSSFLPNNAVLIVVGDIQKDMLLTEIEDHFGDWEPGERGTHRFSVPKPSDERTVTIVDRPGSAQANIVIANLAFDRGNRDFFPAIVMNQILGAGASSRVFMNLREEKGYTYGAYTKFDPRKLAGDFEAAAEVRTTVTGDALREFFYELERIRSEKVLEEELDDAKNFLTGVFPIRAETQEGLTNMLVNQELFSLPHDYLQTYRSNIDAVTIDDVQRVANMFVRPDRASVVIVGDAAEILPQVREYSSSIEIFDTEGVMQEESKFSFAENEDTADVAGKWSLMIDFQGQQLPVSLALEQNGTNATGILETMLGNGNITEGKVTGSRLAATAVAEMQGQSIEFTITGKIEGNAMSGTLTAPIVPEPLPFTGTR